MSDNLSKFGYNFQCKVITSLVTDKLFTQQILDIMSPKFFDTESKQWIVDSTFEHFNKYREAPTLEVFKIKMDKEQLPELLKQTVVEDLKKVWQLTGATDLEYVKDEALEFCRNQTIKKAIVDSIPLLESGNYEHIKVLIDNAMKAGMDREIGHVYNDDAAIEHRYSESARDVSPTPWDAINGLCDGGFGKGELVVFAAGPGVGKSWALVNVGAHALKKGKTVVHYTLELNEAYVGLRYDSVNTGISNANLKFSLDEVTKKVKALPGNLVVREYPSRTASIHTLKAHLDKMILQNLKPDLIIVDYADILKGIDSNRNLRTDQILGNIYTDLRGLAGEYEVPVYTASQIGREGHSSDIVEGDKISGSYEKLMIADFVISLSRKVEDKLAGTGRWHIIKNRFGPDGMTYPSKMNLSNGQINIFEDNSVQGKEASAQMQSGDELVRKKLAQKLKDFG